MKWFDEIEDYDLRQIMRMKHQIKSFQENHLDLGEFIGDLTFLRNNINNFPQNWVTDFNEYLLNLESAYSYLLYNDDKDTKERDQSIIDQAIKGIEILIEKYPGISELKIE